MNEEKKIVFETLEDGKYAVVLSAHSLRQITRNMAILVEDSTEKQQNVDTLYFFLPFVEFLYSFVKYSVVTQKCPNDFDKADLEWIIGAISSWQTLCNKFVKKMGDKTPEFCRKKWATPWLCRKFQGIHVY